ncbi:MAG TPA: hypothetical protein VFY63_08430 [Pseudorhizobium sp.]|nr:hypothetical protein [Pseudorhizobium sp.]
MHQRPPVGIWQEFYAWYPVRPSDETGLFWLEKVWRRQSTPTSEWEYRSFRTDTSRQVELMKRAF